MISNSLPIDAALRTRAQRVIPGGMYGHLNVARLPPGYPQFFARAEGATLWDVDGNAYVDFMCAYGPMVLGYGNREVEARPPRQRALGDVLTGPSERLVELAEKLVGMVAHADWAMFQRNGTDATTLCVVVARAATQKRKILVARGAYHGSAPWCTPHPAGTTAEDRAHLVHYDYNDVASLGGRAVGRGRHRRHHRLGRSSTTPARTRSCRRPPSPAPCAQLCDETGAALILDDVRAGFRLHLGGSWETVGVRPDLAAYSKAIANGYTLAAVTGSDRFRDAAASVFMTGSFWCGAASMAASLKTLEIFERDGTIATMARLGQRFRDGLAAQAKAHGLVLRQTGPAQMPPVLFADDPDVEKGRLFAVGSAARRRLDPSAAQHVPVGRAYRRRHRPRPAGDRRRDERRAQELRPGSDASGPPTKRRAGPACAGTRPIFTSSKKGLDRFLEILGDAEGDLLRRLDLDRLAGRRVAAHARRTIADLKDAEARDADLVALLEVLHDQTDEVFEGAGGVLLGHAGLLGQLGRDLGKRNGRNGRFGVAGAVAIVEGSLTFLVTPTSS